MDFLVEFLTGIVTIACVWLFFRLYFSLEESGKFGQKVIKFLEFALLVVVGGSAVIGIVCAIVFGISSLF